MTKLLLSITLLGALAAPAMAGRLDVDPTVLQPLSISQAHERQAGQVPDRRADVDYSSTRSIQSPEPGFTGHRDATAGLRLSNTDKQRGAQGAFFGANGR